MIRKCSLLIAFLLIFPAFARATVLGDAAASMKAGEWKEIASQGLTGALLRVDPGMILQYCDGGVWDPGSEQFLFLGGAHAVPPNMKFLSYQASANAWRTLPAQGWFCQTDGCVSHANDHHAINVATGEMYYRMFNTNVVRKYKISTGVWTALPTMPTSIGCCGGLAYFPEMGGLVAAGGGVVNFHNTSTGQWTRISPPEGYAMGGYQNFAEYNPVHKVVIFGGGNGSRDIYKLDAVGKVTKMKNAPYSPAIPYSVESVDPVSGDYIFFQYSSDWDITQYAYDVVSDGWRQLPTPPLARGTGLVPVPVSTHGVIMFLGYDWNKPGVYVYKHAQGAGVENTAAFRGGVPGISVSPNPVSGKALIRLAGHNLVRAGVYDTRGRLVSRLSAPGGRREARALAWDASLLPNGLYLVRADFEGRGITAKILVHR